MEKVHINLSHDKLSANFQKQEFYLAANPHQEWDCEQALIAAAQIIREWIGFSTSCNSTYRPNDTFGFHMTAEAIDLLSVAMIHGEPAPKTQAEVLAEFKQECINYRDGKGSKLIEDLRRVGITGFGIEICCIHLDTRPHTFNHTDQYGEYMIFVFRCHYENGKMIVDENHGI